MLRIKTTALAAAAALIFSANAFAEQSFSARAGVSSFAPSDNNGTLAGAKANIDDDIGFPIGFSYHVDENWEFAIDTAATVYKHFVELEGLGEVASLKHHPVTLSANYHFPVNDSFSPYIGLGYSWISVDDVVGRNALNGADLKIDDASGVTAAVGADYSFNEQWFVRGEARWYEFESDVTLGGADIGAAEVDPWQFSVFAGLRF